MAEPQGAKLDAVLGRAIRDKDFRKRLLADSKAIAKEYSLSAAELTTLQNFNSKAADEFFGKVVGGARIAFCTSKTCCEGG